jgi:hypothetical protein
LAAVVAEEGHRGLDRAQERQFGTGEGVVRHPPHAK